MQDIRDGKYPTWNCHKWYHETENFKDLPIRKYPKKKKKQK